MSTPTPQPITTFYAHFSRICPVCGEAIAGEECKWTINETGTAETIVGSIIRKEEWNVQKRWSAHVGRHTAIEIEAAIKRSGTPDTEAE